MKVILGDTTDAWARNGLKDYKNEVTKAMDEVQRDPTKRNTMVFGGDFALMTGYVGRKGSAAAAAAAALGASTGGTGATGESQEITTSPQLQHAREFAREHAAFVAPPPPSEVPGAAGNALATYALGALEATRREAKHALHSLALISAAIHVAPVLGSRAAQLAGGRGGRRLMLPVDPGGSVSASLRAATASRNASGWAWQRLLAT